MPVHRVTSTVPGTGLGGLVATLAGARSRRGPSARLRAPNGRDALGNDRDALGPSFDAPSPGPSRGTGSPREAPGTGGKRTIDPPHRPHGSSATARARRRAIEAELLELPASDTPTWWERCWERGTDGDLVGDPLFDVLAGLVPQIRVLHGLRVAASGTTIDHVLVGAGGISVVGTATCPGRVRSDGVHLRVRGRDRSALVDVALWHAEVVRTTLERRGFADVPVRGVVHWEHLEGLGDRAITLRGVPLVSAGAAVGIAAEGIALSPLMIGRIATALSPSADDA